MEGLYREAHSSLGTGRPPGGLVHQYALQQALGAATASVMRHAGLTQGMRVADIGCGVGLVTLELARAVGESGLVVGIDTDENQLGQARVAASQTGLRNVWFDAGSAENTGLPRSSFELVFSRGALGRSVSPGEAFIELVALLAPGGVLVCEELEEAPDGPVMLPGGRVLSRAGHGPGRDEAATALGIGAWLPGEMRSRGLLGIGVSFCRPLSETLSASLAGGILSSGLALWQVWGRKGPEAAAAG